MNQIIENKDDRMFQSLADINEIKNSNPLEFNTKDIVDASQKKLQSKSSRRGLEEDDSLSMGTNEITATLSKLRRKSTHNMMKVSQAISSQMKSSERKR